MDFEIFVDNGGAVDIYKKGQSTACFYSYTVAKAIYDVARGLNCRVVLSKVHMYSDVGYTAADALSKAGFGMFYSLMPGKNTEPSWVPRTILRWLRDPKDDLDLGKKILLEMFVYSDVIV